MRSLETSVEYPGRGLAVGRELTEVMVGSARAYDGAPELTVHPSLYTSQVAPGPTFAEVVLQQR